MKIRNFLCCTAFLHLISCADTNHGYILSSQSKEVRSISKEDVALMDHERGAALRRLKEAVSTRDDPESWAAVSRFYFENELYAKAIVYAEESLKRDPGNVEAGSIVAVSGLRVSAAAIDRLRRNYVRETGTAPDERTVTKVLRSTLGEETLVPHKASSD